MFGRAGNIKLAFAIAAGLALGVGAYTFIYARGYSYMTNNPEACDNCHIMNTQYNAWNKSTHKAVAVCNDCHAPHHAPLAKLFVKGRNGFNHSLKFTTGRFPEPIRITSHNRRVTEAACRYCHGDIVAQIDHTGSKEKLSCIRCHASVGHATIEGVDNGD